MPKTDNVLTRVREICLSLPDTCETPTWGKPHFRVADKIFAGCGEENGILSIGFKLHMEHAADIVHEPGFSRAPYVGHKGWVSLDASQGVRDWDALRDWIIESYELIAPKRTLAKLAAMPRVERSKPAGTAAARPKRPTAATRKAAKSGSRRKAAPRKRGTASTTRKKAIARKA